MNLIARNHQNIVETAAPRSFLKTSKREPQHQRPLDGLAASSEDLELQDKAAFALRKLCRDTEPTSLPTRFLAKVAQTSVFRASASLAGLPFQLLEDGPQTMSEALTILDSLAGDDETRQFDLNMNGARILLSESGPEANKAKAASQFLGRAVEHDALVLKASQSEPAEIGLQVLNEALPSHISGKEKDLLLALKGLETDPSRAKILGQAAPLVTLLPKESRLGFSRTLLTQLQSQPEQLPWEATLSTLKPAEASACWKEILGETSAEEILSSSLRSSVTLTGVREATDRLQELAVAKESCEERSQLGLDSLDIVPAAQQPKFVQAILERNSKKGGPIAKATAAVYKLALKEGQAGDHLESLLLRTGAEKSLQPLFEAGKELIHAPRPDADSTIEVSHGLFDILSHNLPDHWNQTIESVKALGETLEKPDQAEFYKQALHSLALGEDENPLGGVLKTSYDVWAPEGLGYNADISALPQFLNRLGTEPGFGEFASSMTTEINQMGLTPEIRQGSLAKLDTCEANSGKRVPTASRKTGLRKALEVSATLGLGAIALGGFGATVLGVLTLAGGTGGGALTLTGGACWLGGFMGIGAGAGIPTPSQNQDWFESNRKLDL